MRLSQLFGKTLREDPAEAESVSHRLLLKAGLIAPLTAGVAAVHIVRPDEIARALREPGSVGTLLT